MLSCVRPLNAYLPWYFLTAASRADLAAVKVVYEPRYMRFPLLHIPATQRLHHLLQTTPRTPEALGLPGLALHAFCEIVAFRKLRRMLFKPLPSL